MPRHLKIDLNGDEMDVFFGWRKFYPQYKKTGYAAGVKRRFRRRERLILKRELAKEAYDDR